MQLYSIRTNEYDANIGELLKRRLSKKTNGATPIASEPNKNGGERLVTLGISSDEELHGLASALSELMLLDLRYFEIADMVERLPFSLEEKKRLIKKALSGAAELVDCDEAATRLYDYLTENCSINLEGYIRFRMQRELEAWSVVVDACAEELMLQQEYSELTALLGLFSSLQPCNSGEVIVILNPNGSCTIKSAPRELLKDGQKGFHIDCAPGNNEGILNMLIGLSPTRITLYDLSLGKSEKLRMAIELMFGGRLRPDSD